MRSRKNSINFILTLIIFVVISILSILLFNYVKTLNAKIDYIAKYTQQQNLKINSLEQDINDLRKFSVNNYEAIKDIQNIRKVNNNKIEQVNKEKVHIEEFKTSDIIDNKVTTVTLITLIGNVLRVLIPVIP